MKVLNAMCLLIIKLIYTNTYEFAKNNNLVILYDL